MGLVFTLLKNVAVSTAKGVYNTSKAINESLEEEIDKAKIVELEKKTKSFDNLATHFTPEEKELVEKLAKKKAIVDLAEKSAKSKNELARLKDKYKI